MGSNPREKRILSLVVQSVGVRVWGPTTYTWMRTIYLTEESVFNSYRMQNSNGQAIDKSNEWD